MRYMGALLDFNIHSVAKFQKNRRGQYGEKKSEKNPITLEKKRGSFSPARYCIVLSSLGQLVKFDTLKYRRTLYNYFGQFVWIEKKESLLKKESLHEALTKNRNGKNQKLLEYFCRNFS